MSTSGSDAQMDGTLDQAISVLVHVTDRCRDADVAATLNSEQLAQLLDLAVRLLSIKPSSGVAPTPVHAAGPLTPTEAVTAISRLLDEVDMDLFEVGMWRTWGTR